MFLSGEFGVKNQRNGDQTLHHSAAGATFCLVLCSTAATSNNDYHLFVVSVFQWST